MSFKISCHLCHFTILTCQNRSFLELDYLFHMRVKARAFRTYPINSKSPTRFIIAKMIPKEKDKKLTPSVTELAQADEANVYRDIYDEKNNVSQVEVSQLPSTAQGARHTPGNPGTTGASAI